jgi:hypothetical protein
MMTRLREAGVVPFAWIVDGIRTTDKPSSWSGLADFAQAVRESYRLDFWASMPHYVHFIVEKDALAGVLSPVTREYDIRLTPIRGYSGVSFIHDEVAELWNQIDKPIFCYYLGDFDPSGFDLERDVREKLKRYCSKKSWFGDGEPGDDGAAGDARRRKQLGSGSVLFRRLGILKSDFADFDLLPLAVKDKDPRAKKFRQRHGNRCAEIDALPASELRRRVQDTIELHITRRKEWQRLKRVEAAERETLDKFVAALEGAA